MKKLTVFTLVLALALCSCQPKPRLVILHTNDTHSHLEAERGGRLPGHGGAIERAAFVDSVRKANGADRVLLLHAGDFNQGSSYFSEFGGEVEINVVNALGYDAITLGNHELDNGIEDLGKRLVKLDCEVVCANMDMSGFENYEKVKPYAVFRRGGMDVGVIGLEADISSVVSKVISSRIPMLDEVEVVNKWAKVLKEEEKCDLVIVLSHLGYEEDHELAAKCRNVDLYIGGHSHTFVDGFSYVKDLDDKEIPIITDGCWGLEMGEVKIY